MVNRNIYDGIIEKMIEIGSHYNGGDFEKIIDNITGLRDDFDIKLMIVGHFSAGKSSLLNGLMEKKGFLKEAQEPTTAIATELVYDEKEAIFAYDVNGKKEMYNSDKTYYPNEYNHLEYRLNVPALEKLKDFTIVDTPGFDAGIEAHAKALANYIGFGSAYLVIIDQEKGGIDQTTLEFIQEISNYSSQIAILINKCDKISCETAENIAESSRFTLGMYGLPYEVYTVSKRDENLSDKLISIISKFDAQAAFEKVLVRQLEIELINIERILSVIKNKIYLDTFDVDSDIALYTKLKENLLDTFNKKREDEKEEIENYTQEAMNKIKSTLQSRLDNIVGALISGNRTAAEAVILETIRPIMLDVMEDVSFRQIDSVTDILDFTGVVSEVENVDLAAIVGNLASNLKGLIAQGAFNIKTVDDVETKNKSKNIYRTVAGIGAIATNVIAPWLEIIIVLLPDIIVLLHGILGESETEKAKRAFENQVLPQILNRLYPQMKENMEITIKLTLGEYQKMIDEKVDMITNNLIEAQKIKRLKVEEFENYRNNLANDISTIQKLISEVR